ncbi:TonB-dependent receptor [Adhaeribacter swui]|uniref:TonB-dependent receptor n=1 Tax=Adhaeribacter swui TaxID=2086471 RepID=A0A7G7GES4_9BACT|nr:TonB-dependent receptor [Adhaeribacter swui]QNF35658.1 TonB-dependent receptor [Adhaeribacter swui]
MKLVILLTVICLQVSARAVSQQITISENNISLEKVFKSLRKQTNYSFFYKVDLLQKARPVNLHLKEVTLEEALEKCFENQPFTYEILNKTVVIKPKEVSKPETQNSASKASVDVTLTGKVTSESGEPLIGVTVVLKGTSTGSSTDVSGNYSLVVPDNKGTLVFSYIGFLSKEVVIGNATTLNVTLAPDVKALSEVVVVGYGTVEKKEITGAVSSVSGNEIKNMPVRSASDALQGKAAGVMVTQSSGSPGSMGVVRIRGIGSVNGSNDPLYLVDGLPQSSIGWLNPNDIESMDIHKDASAAAIYGSRASNGVVIITTKRGSKTERPISVSYDAYYGFQSAWKRPHMLNAEEFIEYKNRAAQAVNAPLPSHFSTPARIDEVLRFVNANSGPGGNDWWAKIIDNQAPLQNHNLSFSGGSKNLGYSSSLGYMDQKGIVKGSDYNRISWRTNLDAQLSERIKFGTNFAIVYESRRNIDENNPYTGTIFSAMTADPITPVYRNNLKEVPSFMENILDGYEANNPFSQYAGVLYSNKPNPVAQIERMRQSIWEGINFKGGANAEFKILDPLAFRSNFGLDIRRDLSRGFTPRYDLDPEERSVLNSISNYSWWTNYFIWENTLTFDRTWGNHHVTALAGGSAELTKALEYGASKQGLVNNDEDMRIINAATINPGASGFSGSNSLASYFGRISYNFADRYILTANIRRDGTSRFAKENRWGTFPSVSGAWRFTEEEFLQAVIPAWFNSGKLRGSYGLIGNQNIGSGAYLSTYGNTSRYLFGDVNTAYLGAGRTSIGNPNLQWETSKQADIGLELDFLNGKIGFVADYFNKQVDDMLMIVPLPTTMGYPNFPWSNAGSMVNKGWEFQISHKNKLGAFNYSVLANISTFKNEVLTLGGGEPIYSTAHLGETITKTEEGMPVGYYFGWLTDGIFQTQEEVNNSPQKGLSTPGDLRFKDINGTDANGRIIPGPDGILNASDRTLIGNPWPDFVYGLTLNAAYKGFDVNLFFQGSQGNDVMNILRYDTEAGTGWYNAPKGFLDKAWNGPGSTNEHYKVSQNAGLNTNVSNYFVEDGSYLRLKNIQIGYNLPAKWLNQARDQQLRFFVGAQNLLTFTKYSGLDPEIGSYDPKLTGIDQGYYPQARTFMFGVNAKF